MLLAPKHIRASFLTQNFFGNVLCPITEKSHVEALETVNLGLKVPECNLAILMTPYDTRVLKKNKPETFVV